MSQSTSGSPDEIPAQAERLDIEMSRTTSTTSWKRAVEGDPAVEPREGLGRFGVSFADGENHRVFVAEDARGWLGKCDCKGWEHHRHMELDQETLDSQQRDGSWPCAHLCAVVQLGSIDLIDTPDLSGVAEVDETPTVDPDVEVDEPGEVVATFSGTDAGDDVQEASDDQDELTDETTHAGKERAVLRERVAELETTVERLQRRIELLESPAPSRETADE